MIDFSKTHVLIIGDIMLDEFVYGSSQRQSPEFDAPVINVNDIIQNAGGAANVLMNVLGLGASAMLISAIGEDQTAENLESVLTNQRESYSFLRSSNIETIVKTRLYNGQIPVARIDIEHPIKLTPLELDTFKGLINTELAKQRPDAIIIQDYNKGLLTPALIDFIMQTAQNQQIPVFVDPKVDHYESYAGCTVFKPNYQELSKVLGYNPEKNLVELDKAARKLRDLFKFETLILTLSEKGAYFSTTKESGLVPVQKVENADVCGAGDTFISALCLAISSDLSLNDSILLANSAAHLVCQQKGVQAIQIEELRRKIDSIR